MRVTSQDWLQAQNSVLGAALIDEKAAARILSETEESDYSGVCRTVFTAMRDLFSQGKPVDPVSVVSNLGTDYRSFTAIHTGNQSSRREAKLQISSPAQESMNAKLSWQKLMLTLAANFEPTDLVITLSYRDADLPKRRDEADKRLTKMIRTLRAHRRQTGEALIYVRVTEGYHSGGRLHHHLIINSTGRDYDIIRQLWEKNGDNIDVEPFGSDGAERWGKYLTKEPREKGRRYVGDRTWRCSIHMKKPEVTSILVEEGDDLQPPAGAFVTDRAEVQNCYGRFCHIMAMLPETTP